MHNIMFCFSETEPRSRQLSHVESRTLHVYDNNNKVMGVRNQVMLEVKLTYRQSRYHCVLLLKLYAAFFSSPISECTCVSWRRWFKAGWRHFTV